MNEFIRLLADGLMVPAVLIAAYALIVKVPNAKKIKAYSNIVVAGLITLLSAKLLASVWQPSEARPFELMGLEPGATFLPNAGFPSDHALFAAFLAITVLLVARQKKLGIVMIVLALLICLGRVLALVHSPLDVVGGVAIACFGALWYLQYDPTYVKTIFRFKRKNVVQ